MTHEEILTTLGNYVDYLIAGSSAEAPLWNIEGSIRQRPRNPHTPCLTGSRWSHSVTR